MAKQVAASKKAQTERPVDWERVHNQCYKTVPLSLPDAVERLAKKGERTLSGRFLLKGEDATIDFRDGEMFCLMKGEVVAKWHPFARFVRANKDGLLALYENFKGIGLELVLITGRFNKNGPEDEPLFASYIIFVFDKERVKFLNVYCPMFEWEQQAFPVQLATITCSVSDPEMLKSDVEEASSQMMRLTGSASIFEGTYWFDEDIRFQVA